MNIDLNPLVQITGSVGVILWIFVIISFLGRAVYRDQHLSRASFVVIILALVLLTPSTITCSIAFAKRITKDDIAKQEVISSKDEGQEQLIKEETPGWYWAVYYHFVDPGNQKDATTNRGRIVVGLISILGVLLLNGLLITTLINWFQQRQEQWRNGEIRYTGGILNGDCQLKDYPILIGGNKMVAGIISQIAATTQYIIILSQRNSDEFRRELYSILPQEYHDKLIIYHGDCTSEEEIRNLQVEYAKEVYILGEPTDESNNNSYHDTVNMKCLQIIAHECEKRKREKLLCRVMFEHQTTFSAFQFTDLDKKMEEYIVFRPFNYYETWAQQVLVNHNLEPSHNDKYLPLEGYSGIKKDDDDFVHLIIVGMSRMGYALAIEAAHLAHYPNFIEKKKRTRITFIDPNAREEMSFFTNRFKDLFAVSRSRYVEAHQQEMLYKGAVNKLYSDTEGWFDPLTDPDSTSPYRGDYLGKEFIDIEWEFVQGAIQWNEVQQYIEDAVNAPNSRVTIAACQPNNNEAVATAIYLHSTALEKAQQILVYQRYGTSVIDNLVNENSPYEKLKAFGMENQCFDAIHTDIQEKIAKKFDELYEQKYNELYNKQIQDEEDKQKANPEEIEKEKEEEKKLREIEKLKKYGKSSSAKAWSNLYNANTMWGKLRSIGYKETATNISIHDDILKRVEHNRWNVEQLLLNYSPVLYSEQKEITKDYQYNKGIPFRHRKDRYKGIMKHLDLCSWEVLEKVDPQVCIFDGILTQILPQCYKEIESNIKENKDEKELSTQSH